MYCLFVLCIVCFVSYCVLFVCKCVLYVLYYCHRVATQLQLTNISYQNDVCISVLPHTCYKQRPSHPHPNNILWAVQFTKLFIIKFSQASCYTEAQKSSSAPYLEYPQPLPLKKLQTRVCWVVTHFRLVNFQTFRRIEVCSFSRSSSPTLLTLVPKCWQLFTKRHVVTTQNTWNFGNTAWKKKTQISQINHK